MKELISTNQRDPTAGLMTTALAAAAWAFLFLGQAGCASEKIVCIPDVPPVSEEEDGDRPGEGGGEIVSGDSQDDALEEAPESARFRVMTYNIKSGLYTSLEEVAEAILAESPEIVGLEEVDDEMDRSGGVSQAYRLGQLTGMASLFRTALEIDGGRYGLAVLSSWPILTSEKIFLTSEGEQRILVVADILGPGGRLLHFAVTHLGLQEEERALQAEEIHAALSSLDNVILTGDFNEDPVLDVHSILAGILTDAWEAAGEGDGFTFPADVPARRIDWILVSSDNPEPTRAWVPDSQASDHRPVVVELGGWSG